jgi:hypothetical protein
MVDPTLTPSKLWKRMTPDQRLQAARAFWLDEQAANDHAQAVLAIAQQRKFRPKSVMALDDERKTRQLAGLHSVPETVAARALVAYHLASQRPLMSAFLDALGIAHESGLIQEEDVKPDPDKMPAAVETIARQYPSDDVSLYLNTLVCQDPETWAGLATLAEPAEPARGSSSGPGVAGDKTRDR